MSKTRAKKASPLILIALLSVAAIVVGAQIYQYYIKSIMHQETVTLTVSGIDAYLLSPMPGDYIAKTGLPTDPVTFKAFIQAPQTPGGPLFEVRDMVLSWTNTNLMSADVTVTVSGLPERLTAEIKTAWYACYSLPAVTWYGAELRNDLGAMIETYSNFGNEGIIQPINWGSSSYTTMENGVAFTLTAAQFAKVEWLDQPSIDSANAVSNGMIIHISSIIIGDVLDGGWGDYDETFDMTIEVEISGETA